jgi:hypothetical protein
MDGVGTELVRWMVWGRTGQVDVVGRELVRWMMCRRMSRSDVG